MNVIGRILVYSGIGTACIVGTVNTCGRQIRLDQNRNYLSHSGMSADKYVKIESSIREKVGIKGFSTVFNEKATRMMEDTVQAIKIQKAIDSTRMATRKQILDSLDLVKKAVKHLK